MSVNKVNKTTGDLSLLAGANNITNTTGVAELSALSNIGTSANATQHEINLAIDEVVGGIGTIIQNSGSAHPTTQADFDICSISVPAGTWIIGCFSDLNFDGSASTYNNVIRSSSGNKTVRTVEKNGGGSYVSMFVTLSSTTTFTAGGYGTYDLVANEDNKQSAHIQAIRIK